MTELPTKEKAWPEGLLLHQNLAELKMSCELAVDDLTKSERYSQGSELVPADKIAEVAYLDFAGHFGIMMDTLALEMISGEDTQDKKKANSQAQMTEKFLDVALKDVILNTEPVTTLQPYHKKLEREHDGRLGLAADLGITSWRQLPQIVNDIDLGLSSWARYLNISESSCFVRLAGSLGEETGRFSERTYLRIAQTLLFRSVLKHLLGSQFEPLAFGDRYEGPSLLPRYFDGFINLQSDDEIGTYLLRTSTMETTWVSAIHNFGLAIEDVSDIYPEDIRGILFVPGYPNRDTLKAELFWQNQKKIDITVLYLLDLYELVRIWDSECCLEYIERRAHE